MSWLAPCWSSQEKRTEIRSNHPRYGYWLSLSSHLAGARAPQIHAATQADAQHVLRGPVHQVQVEVVLQLRRVQNLEGDPRDLARRLPGGAEQLLRLG